MREETPTTHAATLPALYSPQRERSPEPYTGTAVILVHGLWTPAAVFAMHSHWLYHGGYRPLRFGYRSVRASLSQNVKALQRFIALTSASQIHLVGHSMGGLIILDLLAQSPDPRLSRAVLLGTPCAGSHCARRLATVPGMRSLLGRSIMEWLSRPQDSIVSPPPRVEVGVLAGTRSVGLGRVVPGLPRPNDGVVALREAWLPGATDFITLRVAHSEMLTSRACAAQIASFLEVGYFKHD